VCSGAAQGRGQIDEMSHTLLTLAENRLYFCTNQGLAAALEAETGAIAWLAQYARGKIAGCKPIGNVIFARLSMTRGTIYLAPMDTNAIFALDAGTGKNTLEQSSGGRTYPIARNS
jgi:outer membrane protein assembly factor BamB